MIGIVLFVFVVALVLTGGVFIVRAAWEVHVVRRRRWEEKERWELEQLSRRKNTE
ncbi:hypothetical protein [Hyphomonas johnsonii]|uniref:hypothetical protein n=1 Tax=Hyphomonas johnsonii TaxID=81031 RepID=UPI0012ECADF7|nr:hypothetical protein [Hyphomonas johnsonii]